MTKKTTASEHAKLIPALRKVLGNTYALYFKTHAFHWNVEGMHFHSLHLLFEGQYTDMWQASDILAERIRSLGSYAPWNYHEMSENSTVKEATSTTDATTMLKVLLQNHEETSTSIRQAIEIAQELGDEVSLGILTDRLSFHEKTIWMLKSTSK